MDAASGRYLDAHARVCAATSPQKYRDFIGDGDGYLWQYRHRTCLDHQHVSLSRTALFFVGADATAGDTGLCAGICYRRYC